jgi:hypothetical protein
MGPWCPVYRRLILVLKRTLLSAFPGRCINIFEWARPNFSEVSKFCCFSIVRTNKSTKSFGLLGNKDKSDTFILNELYASLQEGISKKNLISYWDGIWILNKLQSQKLEGYYKPLHVFSPLCHITKETFLLQTLELSLYSWGLFNDASSSKTTEIRMKGEWWKTCWKNLERTGDIKVHSGTECKHEKPR